MVLYRVQATQRKVQASIKGKAPSCHAFLARQLVSRSVKAARGKRPDAAPASIAAACPPGSSNPVLQPAKKDPKRNPRHLCEPRGPTLDTIPSGDEPTRTMSQGQGSLKRRRMASSDAPLPQPPPLPVGLADGRASAFPRDVTGPMDGLEIQVHDAPEASSSGLSGQIPRDHQIQDLDLDLDEQGLTHAYENCAARLAAPLSCSLKPLPLESPALLLLAQVEQLPDDIHSVELSELNIELSGLHHPATMAMAACIACHLGKVLL